MTRECFICLDKYKRNLNKFIFVEGDNLTPKQYMNLNNEVRTIEAYLKQNEKFLT